MTVTELAVDLYAIDEANGLENLGTFRGVGAILNCGRGWGLILLSNEVLNTEFKCDQRVWKMEHGCFTSLVFTSLGVEKSTHVLYK